MAQSVDRYFLVKEAKNITTPRKILSFKDEDLELVKAYMENEITMNQLQKVIWKYYGRISAPYFIVKTLRAAAVLDKVSLS